MTHKHSKVSIIGLLGASFDTPNLGVSALAESSIKCILNRWPDAEVTLFGSGRTAGEFYLKIANKDIVVRNVPVRSCVNIFLPNHLLTLVFYACFLKLFPFRPVRNFLAERNLYLKLMLETDFFADITGGDSFSDIYGLKRFVFGFFRKLLPIMFNKELILLPQTYGPFNKPLMKCMACYILKHANVIYSRDLAGVEYVSKLLNGAEDKVQCVPDLAFVLDSRRPSDIDIGSLSDVRTDKSVVVGFNISGLLYYGGYTKNNMFGLKDDYQQIICRIIDFLMTQKNVLVLLVPHIFPPVEIFKAEIVENDVAACLDVYKKFHTKYPARIFRVRGRYDQSEIKYIIGLCNFFLGSRMHSTIAALSQCVPAVGMAYSKKFAGVFQTAEVEEYVIDMRQFGEVQILERINELYGTRESARRRLCEVIPKVQEKVMSLFDDF